MKNKYRMELNGVANILLLLESGAGSDMPTSTCETITEQCILIERYMLAFSDAVSKGEQPPFWHEVKANPSKYPRNRER